MKKKKSKIHKFTVEKINELASAFINIAREHLQSKEKKKKKQNCKLQLSIPLSVL